MKKVFVFVQEIARRLASETPAMFRKIRNTGAGLVAVGTALELIPKVPVTISEWAGQLIIVGSVMAAVSQLTVKDPGQQ